MSHHGVQNKQWRQEDMAKALSECRNNDIKVATAAKLYNVPHKTLSDRLKSKVKDDCPGAGRQSILSKKQEQNQCNYIEYIANRGFPLTINQIMMFAWCVDKKSGGNQFEETGPTEGWWNGLRRSTRSL